MNIYYVEIGASRVAERHAIKAVVHCANEASAIALTLPLCGHLVDLYDEPIVRHLFTQIENVPKRGVLLSNQPDPGAFSS